METNSDHRPGGRHDRRDPLELPTRSFEELYHVGTMNPADKGCHSQSLEGDGLSVSLHPDEWTAIARLGEAPTWELTKSDNRFVDFWAIDDPARDHIRSWSVHTGLAEAATLFEVSWDTDCGRSAFLFTDEASATDELEYLDDESPAIATLDGLVGTDLLRTGCGTAADRASSRTSRCSATPSTSSERTGCGGRTATSPPS